MRGGIDFASVVLALLFALPVILIVMLVPALSDWHVAASGDVYVLTYPSLCGLSFQQSGDIIAVDCPNATYVALLIRSPDLSALCNGTALYDGAGIFNGIGGEATAYKGKALLCKLYSSGVHMVLPGRAEG